MAKRHVCHRRPLFSPRRLVRARRRVEEYPGPAPFDSEPLESTSQHASCRRQLQRVRRDLRASTSQIRAGPRANATLCWRWGRFLGVAFTVNDTLRIFMIQSAARRSLRSLTSDRPSFDLRGPVAPRGAKVAPRLVASSGGGRWETMVAEGQGLVDAFESARRGTPRLAGGHRNAAILTTVPAAARIPTEALRAAHLRAGGARVSLAAGGIVASSPAAAPSRAAASSTELSFCSPG